MEGALLGVVRSLFLGRGRIGLFCVAGNTGSVHRVGPGAIASPPRIAPSVQLYHEKAVSFIFDISYIGLTDFSLGDVLSYGATSLTRLLQNLFDI